MLIARVNSATTFYAIVSPQVLLMDMSSMMPGGVLRTGAAHLPSTFTPRQTPKFWAIRVLGVPAGG